jgi:2-keto-4-pentenoate hydratase/2-oxohepta-3-ene-1,7-dioic acid hydratase in catechol pathway
LGKKKDGSAVIGDFTKEQFSSLENLTFELTNNGETVQVSDSSYMLWKIDELISCFSVFTLKIGDIIFTGTPAGVAVKPDDILEDFRGQKLFRIQVK